jgi:hypothetical protein
VDPESDLVRGVDPEFVSRDRPRHLVVGLQLVESKTKFSLPNSMGKLCSFQVILTWQLRREIAQLVVFI